MGCGRGPHERDGQGRAFIRDGEAVPRHTLNVRTAAPPANDRAGGRAGGALAPPVVVGRYCVRRPDDATSALRTFRCAMHACVREGRRTGSTPGTERMAAETSSPAPPSWSAPSPWMTITSSSSSSTSGRLAIVVVDGARTRCAGGRERERERKGGREGGRGGRKEGRERGGGEGVKHVGLARIGAYLNYMLREQWSERLDRGGAPRRRSVSAQTAFAPPTHALSNAQHQRARRHGVQGASLRRIAARSTTARAELLFRVNTQDGREFDRLGFVGPGRIFSRAGPL